MRLMSQFGEVEHFKNMKYDELSAPNTVVIIFKEEGAARNCLQKSPIRFRMGRAPVKEVQSSIWGEGPTATPQATSASASTQLHSGLKTSPFNAPSQSRALSTNSLPRPPRADQFSMPGFDITPPQQDVEEARIFQIRTNPARIHFRDQINTSHFHGRFAIDGKSAAQQDLAKSVPLLGLSHVNWRAEDKPWRIIEQEKRMDGAFRGSGRRRSLTELWEHGQRTAPDEVVRQGGGV